MLPRQGVDINIVINLPNDQNPKIWLTAKFFNNSPGQIWREGAYAPQNLRFLWGPRVPCQIKDLAGWKREGEDSPSSFADPSLRSGLRLRTGSNLSLQGKEFYRIKVLNLDIWICLGFSALSLGFPRRESLRAASPPGFVVAWFIRHNCPINWATTMSKSQNAKGKMTRQSLKMKTFAF